jgi:hypothetical protein
MNESLRISQELIKYLEKLVLLTPNDLKLKDFDRGFKAGQIEIVIKLKNLFEQQERKGPYA